MQPVKQAALLFMSTPKLLIPDFFSQIHENFPTFYEQKAQFFPFLTGTKLALAGSITE